MTLLAQSPCVYAAVAASVVTKSAPSTDFQILVGGIEIYTLIQFKIQMAGSVFCLARCERGRSTDLARSFSHTTTTSVSQNTFERDRHWWLIIKRRIWILDYSHAEALGDSIFSFDNVDA